jgi:RimJ/RimL family protein N-acetyltransferase
VAGGAVTGVPRLETERLVLRGAVERDFEAFVPFYESEVSRFYGGPCDREQAWRKFAVYSGHWMLRGYGPFVVASKGDGAVVGLCGPWFPDGWIEPEITWALVPGHHGQGYATEAARRALDFAYGDLGWRTAVSVISIANEPSIRLAERLGATHERDVDFIYGPARLYRHRPPSD